MNKYVNINIWIIENIRIEMITGEFFQSMRINIILGVLIMGVHILS